MKPTPKNWTRISSALFYQEGGKAIDWLCNAFGFEVRLRIEGDNGVIEHSELTFGDGILMVADEDNAKKQREGIHKSPKSLGGANTQSIMVYVDDVNAHCERARKAGAKIISEPKDTDYGEEHWSDRGYECEDLEGHRWWFCQRLREPNT
ncbi:MAG TPA: VOC family protein [Kofleriaceae bacterium]